MADEKGLGEQAQSRPAGVVRRKIYIRERLPGVLAEMKSLTEEREQLSAKRSGAQPEERRQINRRWNFLVERLAVLRAERAALIGERDGVPSPSAKRGKNEEIVGARGGKDREKG